MPGLRYSPLRLGALYLESNDMRALGVNRTSQLARSRNRRRHQRHLEHRQRLDRLLPLTNGSSVRMDDGWARDDSRSLPHLAELLDEMNAVIEERGLRPWKDWGKPFLKDILPDRSWERYPSLLDFASSPEVLEPMARHAGLVPHLSGSVPPGMRLMESSTKYDPQPDGPWRSSQLWHIDYHAYPLIYVIVAIRDIGPDDGPLNFLGQAASDRVSTAVGYRSRGAPHRVPDEVVDALVEPDEVQRFIAPAGTVLFIDSSRCFHFGSRKPATPRYQLQYAYVTPIRNDFSELIRPQVTFPVGADDPKSRRLALDREFTEK
jgi:hypothetical protein